MVLLKKGALNVTDPLMEEDVEVEEDPEEPPETSEMLRQSEKKDEPVPEKYDVSMFLDTDN